jgi:uncharacterized repeat protein (TIGR04042 family)
MQFGVRWPDRTETTCYSPSLVIEDFLSPGQSYELGDFLERSTTALNIASERVEARYGVPCGRALAQRDDIARRAASFTDGQVTVLAFHRLGRQASR